MRSIIFLLAVFLTSSTWAKDIFDKFNDGLSLVSPHDSMHAWERNLTTNDWQAVLENCYDRNVNPEAKKDLVSLLKEHNVYRTNRSARQKDSELLMYCSHALSIAWDVGIKISVIPLNPEDHKTLLRAETIKECYLVRRMGLSTSLQKKIRMVIGAAREVSGKENNEKISFPELMVAYAGLCGSVFSKDSNIPVQVAFSPR